MYQTVQLTAHVLSGTVVHENKLVTFTSSDPAVAAVDEDGVVYPAGIGTVTLNATTTNGLSDSVTLEVVAVQALILPSGLQTVSAEAFAGIDTELVQIPASCTSIEAGAFTGCGRLQLVVFQGDPSIEEGAFDSSGSFTFICADGSKAAAYAEAHGIAHSEQQ